MDLNKQTTLEENADKGRCVHTHVGRQKEQENQTFHYILLGTWSYSLKTLIYLKKE